MTTITDVRISVRELKRITRRMGNVAARPLAGASPTVQMLRKGALLEDALALEAQATKLVQDLQGQDR